MKKFLLMLIIILSCGVSLAAFSVEDKGMPTIDFATQLGEIAGKAKLCGANTDELNPKFIQSIAILATYRKENVQKAINAYQSSLNRQTLSSPTECSEVLYNLNQVEQHLPKIKEQSN